MKRTILMVLGTVLALSVSSEAITAREERVQKVAALYQQGVIALKDGDTQLATACFREVLVIQPSHGNARYQLLSLKDRKPNLAAKMRQRKLAQIKIPKVHFDESEFGEVIEALDILITKETKGGFAPNFVVQDPHGLLENKKITMKLGSVPANVLLDYVLKMANAKARYDEHAIVIAPLGKAPKTVEINKGGLEKIAAPDDPFTK